MWRVAWITSHALDSHLKLWKLSHWKCSDSWTPWLCMRSRRDPDGLGIFIPGNLLGFKKGISFLRDRSPNLPTSGTQSWGLQDSFSSGFSWGSQRLLRDMSSDRQRTSRTRKPPWQLLEHCVVTKGERKIFGCPLAWHIGGADTGKFQASSKGDQILKQTPMHQSTSTTMNSWPIVSHPYPPTSTPLHSYFGANLDITSLLL